MHGARGALRAPLGRAVAERAFVDVLRTVAARRASTPARVALAWVLVQGAFGKYDFVEDVIPTAENPKTGKLVGMAVVKAVRQLTQPVVVGL